MKGLFIPASIVLPTILWLGPPLTLVASENSVKAAHIVASFAAHTDEPAGTATRRIKDAPPAADDTGRNERDQDGQTMTPLDQSSDPKDLKITRNIRQALMADEALSMTAKNIKIITVHGKVILRGPVANLREKTKIARTAQKFTKQRVLNELEVAAQ